MSLFKKFHFNFRINNLQRRFIVGVLAPPFFILLILGIILIWQLNNIVQKQAIDNLKRASSTSAVKMEREFAIRKTILKRTGEELFSIKSSYAASRQTLDQNHTSCFDYVKTKKTYLGAPNGICDQFLPEFASQGNGSLLAVENGYARNGEELFKEQNQNINERLAAFKQFFPETVAVLVLDKNHQLISSAQANSSDDTADLLIKVAVDAQKSSVEGKLITIGKDNLAVFSYSINGGSVLAAYDLSSDSFIRQTWESTPIEKRDAIAIFVDSGGHLVYPALNFSNNIQQKYDDLRKKNYANLSLKKINHIAVATEIGKSKWAVIVASPEEAVLAPVRDAQLAAVFVIGMLIVGFLWVGTFFIQRTLNSILRLVSGALVFSGGKLDYKIHLEKADTEFVALADTMNKMAERIAAAEKEIDEKNKEFISVATHELRTPLTAIIGNLSMIYDDMGDKLDVTVKPLVEQVYSSSKRLKDLVNDMLDVARLEGGRAEFNITKVNTSAVSSEVINNLQITAKEKGISLTYNPAGAAEIMADESRLRIILNNFVSNAIKYNRPNGSIVVSHVVKDNKLVTAIADTGLGIPEDQKTHMFEKFFRVQNDDRKNVVGTGLGMFITRQYILAMGGELTFESVHGQGTTFYFSLPLATNESSPLQKN